MLKKVLDDTLGQEIQYTLFRIYLKIIILLTRNLYYLPVFYKKSHYQYPFHSGNHCVMPPLAPFFQRS